MRKLIAGIFICAVFVLLVSAVYNLMAEGEAQSPMKHSPITTS